MSPTPPLYLCKRLHLHPCSMYVSPQTLRGTTHQYPSDWPKQSSTWMRVATSKTLHMLSPSASSPWYTNGQQPPIRALPKPTTTSISSMELYTPTKPKSTAYATGQETLRCPPPSSTTGDKWTSKCPPIAARMSSPDGSKSWGTVRLSPEQEKAQMSWNMWSPSTFQQTTTHSTPPQPYPHGLWSYSRPKGAPTTLWLKQPTPSNTPPLTPKSSDTATTTSDTQSWKSTDGQLWLKSSKKMKPYQGSNTAWRPMASTNTLPTSRAAWTSDGNSHLATTMPTTQLLLSPLWWTRKSTLKER